MRKSPQNVSRARILARLGVAAAATTLTGMIACSSDSGASRDGYSGGGSTTGNGNGTGTGTGNGTGNGTSGSGSIITAGSGSSTFGGATIELGGPASAIAKVRHREVQQQFYIPPKFKGSGCTQDCGTEPLCGKACKASADCGTAHCSDGLCTPATDGVNYGEAVQKSLYFFNIQKSGPVSKTTVQWRGDSHLEDAHIKLVAGDPNGVNMSQAYIDANRAILDPDGNGEVDMSGGFYDAGDFLKIGATSNYAAHTLGWVLWDFPDTFQKTGLGSELLSTLKWAGDWYLKNTYLNKVDPSDPWTWKVVAYGHQVGGASDHECGWMPPELRRTSFCPRKGYFATQEAPAADVTSGAAAALALIGFHMRYANPEYATQCLNTAIALYEFAKANHTTGWSVDGGLYEAEYAYDDLAWAALWIHEVLPDATQPGASDLTKKYASHKDSYIDDILSKGAGTTGWIENFNGGVKLSCFDSVSAAGSCWTESWGHVWRSLRSGVFVKLASVLERYGNKYGTKVVDGFKKIARDDQLAWVLGPKTPGGFSHKVDVSWGSGRYNSAGQLTALSFARNFPNDVVPNDDKYVTAGIAGKKTSELIVPWAKSQAEYLLGKNPLNLSYMQGYGDKFATNVHHAATHASIYGLCGNPVESKHIAYGALVSGPNSGDDHSEDRCDYGANEITIDYNAAFFGALAGNYAFEGKGQCPVDNFPPVEPPNDEFYTESKINDATNPCRSQVTITLVNETDHPPRYDKNLTVRYYIDASELQAKGIDPSTISAKIIHEEWGDQPTTLSELKSCSLNTSTFYFEMAHPYEFWGRQVKLHGPRTVLLDIGVGNGPGCTWDPTNDFSFTGLTTDDAKSKQVPAYSSGDLVWGAEPECDEPPAIVVPAQIVR